MATRFPTPPPAELAARVADVLGAVPVDWWRPHTGLSPAQRFVVRCAGGARAFVKAAVDDETARQLRVEHAILAGVTADFHPRCLAWNESDPWPLLIVEDLSDAHWPADHVPVTWRPGQPAILFDTLARVGRTPAPLPLPAAAADFTPRWPELAGAADRLRALQLCSVAWLGEVAGALIAAEATVPLAGDALVHHDVRSDNLCFVGRRLVLVDWGDARRGHPDHDLAAVLPTLALECGTDPAAMLPNAAWAAHEAGRYATRITRRLDPGEGGDPQWLHHVLRRLAVICLDWAARCLDLPPRDGPRWQEL